VADEERAEETTEVVCPHCKKTFTAGLMAGDAERYRGYKCPHCRLFVPFARAEERDLIEPTPRDPAA
jgi:DNA-directed RNA polymerase subunit RPC12/RpoP